MANRCGERMAASSSRRALLAPPHSGEASEAGCEEEESRRLGNSPVRRTMDGQDDVVQPIAFVSARITVEEGERRRGAGSGE